MKGLNFMVAVVVVVLYWCSVSSLVSGDVVADRKECMQPLMALAPCLTFVQGNGGSGSPPPNCCKATRMLLDTNIKCLCVLIKDRESAGIAFNVTTAIHLPSLCQAFVNATHCIDLLQLPAKSPDAKLFKQLANTTATTNATIPTSPGSGSGAAVAGSGSAKSGWNESRGVRLVGIWVVLLWGWFLMLSAMPILN